MHNKRGGGCRWRRGKGESTQEVEKGQQHQQVSVLKETAWYWCGVF